MNYRTAKVQEEILATKAEIEKIKSGKETSNPKSEVVEDVGELQKKLQKKECDLQSSKKKTLELQEELNKIMLVIKREVGPDANVELVYYLFSILAFERFDC